MSLFNICNWWSTQCSDLEDNYDVASLLCARFGVENMEKSYIVVGTHGGHLSIYYPSYEADVNGKTYNYRATDLLLEQYDSSPILGVYAGRFSSNQRSENTNQLAILHPYTVVIYNLQSIGGITEHGAQLQLQQLHAYRFKRSAFSLCKGHFGKVKGREFFCITHLDGSLTFYEQDGITYECKFPGERALPTPLVYGERTDSFFRLASAWNLECFTYQDLSHSSINNSHYQPVWSVCLGEGIVDMSIVQVKSNYASIMILGEHNFLCVSDTGKVEFILKLDYIPKCFYSFVVGYYWEPTARLITIIASDKSKLFIYENANIIWGAHTNYEAPVAIQRSNLNGLPGCIVTLGPTGQLRLGYLGSDPYVFKIPPLTKKDLSFHDAFAELQQLEQEIKIATDLQDMEAINKQAYDDVQLTFVIHEETKTEADNFLMEDIPANVALKELPISTGQCSWSIQCDLSELQILFNMPEGIRCSQDPLTYTLVKAGSKETLHLEFYIAELLHFPTSKVEVLLSFITLQNVPRVIQQSAYLPLSMFFKVHQPQKTAIIKLTYTINLKSEKSLKLNNVLPEFVNSEDEEQALGLMLLTSDDNRNGETVTVLLAKNSNRVRIQSDVLESFPLIVERLLHKSLEGTDKSLNNEKLKVKGQINGATQYIMANSVIPHQAILQCMDVHYETQENIRKQQMELDLLWQKFKDLQRNLQEKLDDEPKESVVMQIEENYDKLIQEGDKLMELRKIELRQRCNLSCALTVAKLIINTLKLEEKLINIITSVLSVPAEDWTESSWEETISPSIDMLHHYGPLQSNKTTTTSPNNMLDSTLQTKINFDYKRFRYQFATLFERLIKLAGSDENTLDEVQTAKVENVAKHTAAIKAEVHTVESKELGTMHSILKVQPMPISRAVVKRLTPLQRSTRTLEAVTNEDDEEDEEDDDDEDLRKLGYRKDYAENKDEEAATKWLDENYKLPTPNELFNDLGVWW